MKFGQWAKKSALSVIAAIIYAVFAALVPFGEIAKLFGGSLSAVNLSGAICKAVCALPPLLFIFAVGFGGELRSGVSLKRLALCLPALVVAINNFPILPLINDDVGLKIYIGDILPYILYCISVGVLEEFVFRGIVLPLLICRLPKNKKGLFAAVMISSALFGGLHLMNLLGGFSLSVFLQVAYSFLIGALFGACMLFTGNLFVPVALHVLFDLGGFLFEAFGYGRVWTAENIILTAIVAIAAAATILAEFIKTDSSFVCELLGISDRESGLK